MRIFSLGLIGLGLCAWFGMAQALPGDHNQPIELEADSVDLNEKTGQAIYKGNVELNQGSIRLQAQEVRVLFADGKPAKVIATGYPVRFRQRPAEGQDYHRGQARKAEYSVHSSELIMTGSAVMSQGKNTFRSERIVYDRAKGRIKAGQSLKDQATGNQPKERVKITLDPASFGQ